LELDLDLERRRRIGIILVNKMMIILKNKLTIIQELLIAFPKPFPHI